MTSTLFIVFGIALLIGLPVALVMGLATLLALIADGNIPLEVFPQRIFSGINSFPMMTIPFFILAADLMTAGKLTDILIKLSNNLIGHIRGGLGHVNVLVSTFFAGISGSALADAAGPGSVIMRMMRENGYDKYYSGALTAATSVIGNIIPPSILMIIYALTAGNSSVTVMGLFLSGVIPGLLIALFLMIANYIISVRKGYQFKEHRSTLREIGTSIVKSIPALLMPIILLGGILSGMFTATESAAVAVAYALLVGMLVTRTLNIRNVPVIFAKSAVVTASVLLIIAMGSAFSWVLTFAQVPQNIAIWMSTLTESPLMVLFLIAIFALITGMFIDTIPALIILTPVLAPVAAQFGVDPLQTAMVIVLCITIGMLTPPVAPLLFVVSTVGRLRLDKVAIAVLPLLFVELLVVLLIILIPELTTWLPSVVIK